jgi:hypothetical protein
MTPPPWEDRPFDHISLSEDQAHNINCAFGRRRDLRSLAGDALFFSLVLEGRSPRIDEAARAAIRHYTDLTRLLLAAVPARAEDLNLKLAALAPPTRWSPNTSICARCWRQAPGPISSG